MNQRISNLVFNITLIVTLLLTWYSKFIGATHLIWVFGTLITIVFAMYVIASSGLLPPPNVLWMNGPLRKIKKFLIKHNLYRGE